MFIAEVLNLGFAPYLVPYERPEGLNKTKSRWTLKKKVKAALDSIFSNSTYPLRLISYMGITISLLSIMAICFYLYISIWGNHEFWGVRVPGWTSIILLLFFIGGLVMLSIGVISEYLWRVFDEVKNRPGFIIKKK
jgi:dolichol-phosphate mannosyltransferase